MNTFFGKEVDFGVAACQVVLDFSLEVETDLICSLLSIGEEECIILIIVILSFDHVVVGIWFGLEVKS